MLLVFAVYPAHPAACDPAYPVILLMLAILYHPISVLSLMRMSYTTGFTSFTHSRLSLTCIPSERLPRKDTPSLLD